VSYQKQVPVNEQQQQELSIVQKQQQEFANVNACF
jgi:hypothetical protein